MTAPSSVFSVTLPVKPSVMMTSALRRATSRPSTLPAKPFTSANNSDARLRNASPLPGSSPFESNAIDGSATPRRTRAYARASSAHSTSHSGSGSTVAPPSTSSCIRSSPNTGSGTAIAGRWTPLIRPNRKSAAAIVAPVLPAPTIAAARPSRTASAASTIDDRFLARTAAAGSSSMAITSGASRISTPAGGCPSGRCAASTSAGPTSRMPTAHASTAFSAPATISAGARSPPIASIAITGGTVRSSLLDVEDLPASIPPTVATHHVGKPRRAAVRAQRMRRGRKPHVCRLARAGRRAAHLALRDGHGSQLLVKSKGREV